MIRISTVALFLLLFSVWANPQNSPIPVEMKLPVLDPAVEKRIEERTPKALPQSSKAMRPTTDAENEGLKGKVEHVVQYSKYFRDSISPGQWRISKITEYSSIGDLVRNVLFGGDPQPYSIEAYGYIDGHRVVKTNSYHGNSGSFVVSGTKDKPIPKTKRDNRYTLRYEHVYKDDELLEKKLYNNDGTMWMRYIYTRTPDTRSYSSYDANGRMKQKFEFNLDGRGNELEKVNFDVLDNYGGDRRFFYTYHAFDENGNWTYRTSVEELVVGGVNIRKPYSEELRVFKYYD